MQLQTHAMLSLFDIRTKVERDDKHYTDLSDILFKVAQPDLSKAFCKTTLQTLTGLGIDVMRPSGFAAPTNLAEADAKPPTTTLIETRYVPLTLFSILASAKMESSIFLNAQTMLFRCGLETGHIFGGMHAVNNLQSEDAQTVRRGASMLLAIGVQLPKQEATDDVSGE